MTGKEKIISRHYEIHDCAGVLRLGLKTLKEAEAWANCYIDNHPNRTVTIICTKTTREDVATFSGTRS